MYDAFLLVEQYRCYCFFEYKKDICHTFDEGYGTINIIITCLERVQAVSNCYTVWL